MLISLIVAAMGAVMYEPPPAKAQDRLNVYVLEYVSVDQGARQGNAIVANVVQDRLSLLATQIAGRVRTAGYVNRLQVVRQPSVAAGSVASMQALWRRTGNALLFMSGSINGPNPNNLVATSTIFIGDLAQPPLDRLELAQLQISASRHQELKDSHSFVAAFALLQDARRARAPKATIAAIVAQLNSQYTRLRGNPYRLAEFAQLKQAIDAIARAEGLPQ